MQYRNPALGLHETQKKKKFSRRRRKTWKLEDFSLLHSFLNLRKCRNQNNADPICPELGRHKFSRYYMYYDYDITNNIEMRLVTAESCLHKS